MNALAFQAPGATKVDAGDVIQLDVPASLMYLNVLGACLVAFLSHATGGGLPGTDSHGPTPNHCKFVEDVELAVHEACTNIVNHAYRGAPGKIRITLRWSQADTSSPNASLAAAHRVLFVEIEDNGPHVFDLAETAPCDLDHPHEHGYGLFLMHRLMDEVTYEGRPGLSRWRLVKRFY